MSNICAASNCDQPADDGFICGDTLRELEQYLAETPWLIDELNNALSKQTKFGAQGGKISTSGPSGREAKLEGVAVQPLIINPDASDALAALTATLLLWQADIADSLGTPVRYPRPSQAAGWLMSNLRNIRTFIAAGDMYDEIRSAHKHGRNIIDRPSEKLYLGECGGVVEDVVCTEPLWGSDRDQIAQCKACGAEWDQPTRLVQIRETAATGLNDRIMTATEAARVLAAYNLTTAEPARMADRIRKWAEQPKDPKKQPKLMKKMDLRLPGARLRPGYKFGDIIDLVNNNKTRAS